MKQKKIIKGQQGLITPIAGTATRAFYTAFPIYSPIKTAKLFTELLSKKNKENSTAFSIYSPIKSTELLSEKNKENNTTYQTESQTSVDSSIKQTGSRTSGTTKRYNNKNQVTTADLNLDDLNNDYSKMSFKEAFNTARDKGLTQFKWKNKAYNTVSSNDASKDAWKEYLKNKRSTPSNTTQMSYQELNQKIQNFQPSMSDKINSYALKPRDSNNKYENYDAFTNLLNSLNINSSKSMADWINNYDSTQQNPITKGFYNDVVAAINSNNKVITEQDVDKAFDVGGHWYRGNKKSVFNGLANYAGTYDGTYAKLNPSYLFSKVKPMEGIQLKSEPFKALDADEAGKYITDKFTTDNIQNIDDSIVYGKIVDNVSNWIKESNKKIETQRNQWVQEDLLNSIQHLIDSFPTK